MPGAWEVQRPEVLVAILTRELVTMKWALGLRNVQLPAASAIVTKSGMPFDHARNTACEDALQHGFQWLFFLDDDVVPPPDVYARLARHDKDIVSGLYYRRAEPIAPVMMAYDSEGQAQWITQWSPPNSLIEADLVGAGCLLIHRRVLEQMPKPWFEWQLGRDDLQHKLSEDFAFCRRAKKDFGFSIHVDTSVACEHIGFGQSELGGSFRPSHV